MNPRTCVGCRQRGAATGRGGVADGLVRFVLVEGRVTVDPDATAPGRGAWLHSRAECWQLAVTRDGFARSFRMSVQADATSPLGW